MKKSDHSKEMTVYEASDFWDEHYFGEFDEVEEEKKNLNQRDFFDSLKGNRNRKAHWREWSRQREPSSSHHLFG